MTIIAKRREEGLKISLMSFDLIYFIQLKRIAFGFSQEELSFLIGRENGFVSSREAFKENSELWMGDISMMSKIFDCTITDFFRAIKGERNHILIFAQQIRTDDKIHYEVIEEYPDGSHKLLYQLNEIDPLKWHTEKLNSELLLLARKEIATLMEEGYFSDCPRSPYEIFLESRKRAGLLIKARFIAHALHEYLTDTSRARASLKRYKLKDKGFVYEEVSKVNNLSEIF